MDSFTITAYAKATQIVTITFVLVVKIRQKNPRRMAGICDRSALGRVPTVGFRPLAARPGYAGETLTGVKLKNPPTDSIASVKAFFRSHADGYIAGKIHEEAVKVDIADEVKTLLNVNTSF